MNKTKIRLDGTTRKVFEIGDGSLDFSLVTTPYSLVFPFQQGAVGQTLVLDGAGKLQWFAPDGRYVLKTGDSVTGTYHINQLGVSTTDFTSSFLLARPDATSNPELQLYGGTWGTYFDDSIPHTGIRLGGNYLALESTDISVQLNSAQPGSRVIVAGLTERGNAILGVEPPPIPDYVETATGTADVIIYNAGAFPSAWVPIGDLLTIEQDIPANGGNVRFEVLVENTSDKDGEVEIGVSLDGAAPTVANSIGYTIGPLVKQIYASTMINVAIILTNATARLMARAKAGKNGLVLNAVNSERPSVLKVIVLGSGSGGGPPPDGDFVLKTGDTMSGPLGIGGARNAAMLFVASSSATHNQLVLRDTRVASLGTGPAVLFEGYTNGVTNPSAFSYIVGGKENATADDKAGNMSFYVANAGGVGSLGMRLTSAGSLAIGTTAPLAKLHVAGNGIFGVGGGVAGSVQVHQWSTFYAKLGMDSTSGQYTTFLDAITDGSVQPEMQFRIQGSESMRLKGNYVYMGMTAGTNSRLNVTGGISNFVPAASIGDAADSHNGIWSFNVGTPGGFGWQPTNGNSVSLFSGDEAGTGWQTRFKIKARGDVGLWNGQSWPWSGGYNGLDFGYIGFMTNLLTNHDVYVVGNAYYDGVAGSWKYKRDGFSHILRLYNGEMEFSSSATGVAGAVAAHTQRLNVTAGGTVTAGAGFEGPGHAAATWNDTTHSKNFVAGMLAWRNYGNNHVLFDASAGLSPSGSAVNNANSTAAWTPTFGNLMGWNGVQTYGVRVDSARIADTANAIGGTPTGDVMLYRGALSGGNADPGTSSGYYYIDYNGNYSDSLLTFNPGGSTGATQLRFAYAGNFWFRNKTDNSSWTGWKEVITTQNIGAQTVAVANAVPNHSGRGDVTPYPVLWAPAGGGGGQPTFSCPGVTIKSSEGSLTASELYSNNWIRSNASSTGWYSQAHAVGMYAIDSSWIRTYNSVGMYANYFGGLVAGSSYGSIRVLGAAGSYGGMYLGDCSGTVVGMYDTGGNGGNYDPSTGWHFYYLRGTACLGIGGSETTAGYKCQINGNLRVTSGAAIQGGVTFGDYLYRSAHHTGCLVGGYNNIGASGGYSNPIYCIGSSYLPPSAALTGMYGVGYTVGSASYAPGGAVGWGLYACSAGVSRVFLDSDYGKIYATNDIIAYASDKRLKTNIKPIEDALSKVESISGVEFDWLENIEETHGWKPSYPHETGVIAQEIQAVIPDAITQAPMNTQATKLLGIDNHYLTVDTKKIIPLLIEAIKELSEINKDLTRRIQVLEGS